ncbi:MAG: DUF2786 domain-containing protein [Nocardioides sp.]
MSDDNRLARIRKLLAQAEDPACTPAEAEAFTAKAADLMARYGIDEALLAQSDPGRDPMGDRVVDLLAPYGYEKAWLGAELRRRAALSQRDQEGAPCWQQHLLVALVRPCVRPHPGRDPADQPVGAGQP